MTTPHPATHLEVTNPATGKPAGRVPIAAADDVAAAARRARAAQPAWEAAGWKARAAMVRRFHDLILGAAFERVLDTIQDESGKARRDALAELLTVAGTARYYLAHGRSALRPERRRGALPGLTRAELLYKPYGLVGLITPWNYPFLLGIGDALPALLAGNAVLAKPSELTPLSTALARELLIESGLPDDVLQVVHGPGATTGAAVPGVVDSVGFTGGGITGRKVAVAAAERLIPCSLELGGKNPMIVLPGARLDQVMIGLLAGAFSNSGQTCISVERIYVHDAVYDDFVAAARRTLDRLRLGWSRDLALDMGSLISAEHAAKVVGHIEDAVARGATVLAGGGPRPDLGPTFVAPTLLAGVTPQMRLAREETFGPVSSVYRVRDVEEAVRLANDSEYGLNASVWAGSVSAGRRVARRLETGSVGVNATLLIYHSFDTPMGGVKASGVGRRHGPHGIRRYVQAQSVVSSRSAGGGYESLLVRADDRRWERALRLAFRLWRHVPGLR
jgi:succinate-semialdehyde dehydrogenase/glutarate-semialdehyde dehydrogenase